MGLLLLFASAHPDMSFPHFVHYSRVYQREGQSRVEYRALVLGLQVTWGDATPLAVLGDLLKEALWWRR